MNYTVFVDESGDQGINKIRTSSSGGQSPYLTLGAALVKDDDIGEITAKIKQIADEVKGNQRESFQIHFSQMKHKEKVYVCQKFAQLPVIFLGLISKKGTLGGYAQQIKHESAKYYNKNIEYLLEIVGQLFSQHNIGFDKHQIIFEEIKNFNYQQTKNYIDTVRANPMHQKAHQLKHINPSRIESEEKSNAPLLCLADCVAYSLHQCCQDWKGVYEPRYIHELRSRFHCDREKYIKYSGIKFIHTIAECVPPDVRDFFEELKAE